ncbi:helix-turn-helix domain-containing protein [Mesorhizobium sp. B2-4-10]|nr:helix-turn-helix domain-containing protein [Mesorhizobium sp. B2-4-10]
MKRTAWLQDRRMQKFRDVLSRWNGGDLSMMEAGELLGMSERQFRRYRDRYEEAGEAGLLDRRPENAKVSGRFEPLEWRRSFDDGGRRVAWHVGAAIPTLPRSVRKGWGSWLARSASGQEFDSSGHDAASGRQTRSQAGVDLDHVGDAARPGP